MAKDFSWVFSIYIKEHGFSERLVPPKAMFFCYYYDLAYNDDGKTCRIKVKERCYFVKESLKWRLSK